MSPAFKKISTPTDPTFWSSNLHALCLGESCSECAANYSNVGTSSRILCVKSFAVRVEHEIEPRPTDSEDSAEDSDNEVGTRDVDEEKTVSPSSREVSVIKGYVLSPHRSISAPQTVRKLSRLTSRTALLFPPRHLLSKSHHWIPVNRTTQESRDLMGNEILRDTISLLFTWLDRSSGAKLVRKCVFQFIPAVFGSVAVRWEGFNSS